MITISFKPLIDTMESTETKICRLCFSTQGHLIDIFNENNLNVVEIIDGHIGEVKFRLTSILVKTNSNDLIIDLQNRCIAKMYLQQLLEKG